MRRKEPKQPFWGQNAIYGLFAIYWTIPPSIPSCIVMTVPKIPKWRSDTVICSVNLQTVV